MKFIFTLGIVLSLLITAAYAEDLAEQKEKNIEICTHNLLAIGKAVQAYHKEHGDYPKWLSDLHPKYLTDANLLVCPADGDGGNPRLGGHPRYVPNPTIDGKIPGSYDYQFHPSHRNESRIKAYRAFYGDVVPLARCWHHSSNEFRCLNLDFSYNVYKSELWWNRNLEMVYGGVEPAIAALEVGLKKMGDQEYFFHVYPALTHLYIKVQKKKEAENLLKRYKRVIKPNSIRHNLFLEQMLQNMNRGEELLQLYKNLEQQYPGNRTIFRKLAKIYESQGNSELAKEYLKKAEPISTSIGKTVPDFSATDLDGKPISIEAYRGKIVLLDFWAVWCGPCVAEMPNVKKVYNTYKDKGFDIIGISLDNDETRLRDFLKENDIPWRQVFDGQGWDSTVPQQYGIRGIPSMWLIDKEGKLISNQARGEKLETLVAEALKDKSVE